MIWLLLNQLCVSSDFKNSRIYVLEELVSSELQLGQGLASAPISYVTMKLLTHGIQCFNQTGRRKEYHL